MKFVSIKIENGEGLFSTGGRHPRFTKRGKTWSTIGHVSSHLGQLKDVPNDWTIAIAEMSDDGFTPSSIHYSNAREHWEGVIKRKQEKKEKSLLDIQKRIVLNEQRELERLQLKYGVNNETR